MNSVYYKISVSAKDIKQNACVIGKNVLSFIFKKKKNKNIDIFTEKCGINLAQEVSKKYYNHPIITVFKRFGIARFKIKDDGNQLEFISNGNQINIFDTFAISLNRINYGILIDYLNINNNYYKYILCIIRSIRFASELQLIKKISFFSIFVKRKEFIIPPSIEGGIINDLNKIILSHNSSIGLFFLYETGLLSFILPEINCLKELKKKKGSNHKNNFIHTLEVLENVSRESNNLWLRWAALLHDIGKSITKKYINGIGWTFYTHEYIGSRMIPYIFYRLKLPMNCTMKYVQKIIQYSSRTINLVSLGATDSAIRRLLFSLGEDLEDLLLLSRADITTKNIKKKLRYMNNILLVENKLKNIDIKNNNKSWLTYISGNKIIQYFQLQPSIQVGLIKKALIEAITAGKLINNFYSIYSFMLKRGKKLDFAVKLIGDNSLN